MSDFGSYLKTTRKNLKLTQSEFCEIIGIGVSTLVKYERGTASPTEKKEHDIKKRLQAYQAKPRQNHSSSTGISPSHLNVSTLFSKMDSMTNILHTLLPDVQVTFSDGSYTYINIVDPISKTSRTLSSEEFFSLLSAAHDYIAAYLYETIVSAPESENHSETSES